MVSREEIPFPACSMPESSVGRKKTEIAASGQVPDPGQTIKQDLFPVWFILRDSTFTKQILHCMRSVRLPDEPGRVHV